MMPRSSLLPAVRATPRRSLTLLESGRTLTRAHLLQTAAGMLLHGSVVIGTFVLATRPPADGDARDPDRRPLFLAPEPKPVSATPQERLQYVGLAGGPVPAPATERSPDGDAGTRVEVPGMEQHVLPVDAEEPAYEEFVLSEIDVDSAVTTDPESGGPEYPPELLTTGLEGAVAARFIVDSTGRVKPGSFNAFESTHPRFTQAVVEALPRMKFRPAYVGKKRVPQLVVQSFAFRIAKGDTLVRDTLAVRGATS
jgi:TonB family protein